jgi:hypothetical protein
VSLRVAAGPAGVVARVASGAPIERVAAKWMYVLRNRARWASDADVRAQVVEGAVSDLAALGIAEADLRQVLSAPSRHVEVIVHDDGASGGTATPEQHAAAAFPWEFALAAATRAIGRSGPLLVTRVLQRRTANPGGAPRSFLFVQSAPGRLRSVYSFESERARLRAATSPRTGETRGWRLSDSGRLDRIERRVRKYTPDAIHISGIDNHQAARLIHGFYAEGGDAAGPPTDGMVVRGQSGAEHPASFDVLARNIVPDGTSPMLVSCNLYYSSARIAQEFVRRGAYASVGFQDEVNDDVAELFFQVFYRCWVQGGHARDLPWRRKLPRSRACATRRCPRPRTAARGCASMR